jgi:polygalacturonase
LGENVCEVKAVGDNKTSASAAFASAIDLCRKQYPENGVVFFRGPAAGSTGMVYRLDRSIALGSNITILIDKNTTLQWAITPEMPIEQNPACATLYWPHGGTALLCGTNLTNVAVLGLDKDSSVIDGGGWAWYLKAMGNKSWWGQGPRLWEPAWSKNVTISTVALKNSPSWTAHPMYCEDVLAEFISILNPRFTPNTDGFDPDSCSNVVLRDSLIDTGDDGISIKSSNSSQPGSKHIQVPAKNIHIYRTTILSRNFCVGSATFGGVVDMVVEDCTIGDDHGSR